MGLGTWLRSWKLARVERKLKSLHVRQRQLRDRLADLEDARRKRGMSEAERREKATALDAERHDVTARVNALVAEEHALRAALGGKRRGSRS